MAAVYIFLAHGFEEVEAFTPIDLLRRAGLPVKRVGLAASRIRSNSGTAVVPDYQLDEMEVPDQEDLLIIPGGSEGAENLSRNTLFISKAKQHFLQGGRVAAICISPAWVLGRHGFLKNRKYTCYPGGEKDVAEDSAVWVDAPVVLDGNLITSRGVGTAALFSIVLVAIMRGKEVARKMWKDTLLHMSLSEFPEKIIIDAV